jgi:TetR/AcrR family transcriptional regulator
LHLYLNKRLISAVSSTTTTRRRRARLPGRPAGGNEDDIRNALLDAASKLFLKHGFERVTARQIAAAAGTTPAMIHYYFSNKLGLFRAMLDGAIAPLRERLAWLLGQTDGQVDIPSLIAMHMRTVATHSWIPVFIVNEVLAEKGRFRATFLREIASRQLPLVVELLERGRANGTFRQDLNPRLAALSLLSLCMFPFLTKPVSSAALGLQYEGEGLEQLIEHTARLFLRGIEYRPQEPSS